ncbi:MAG: hypothetical protein AAF950_12035 [Pseudomonadota bacterium]
MDPNEDAQACGRIYKEYLKISAEEAEITNAENRIKAALAVPERHIRALEKDERRLIVEANKNCTPQPRIPSAQRGPRRAIIPSARRDRGITIDLGRAASQADDLLTLMCIQTREAARRELADVQRRLETFRSAREEASDRLAKLSRRRDELNGLRATLDSQAATHRCDFSRGRSGR